MNVAKRIRPAGLLVSCGLVVSLLAGCTKSNDEGTASGPVPEWALSLDVDGAPVKIPLEVMDVYLVEDNVYPEVFEIRGQGVTLVGAFPLTIHVDYGEDWAQLKGQSIPISGTMEHPSVSADSTIQLPGATMARVVNGNFTVNTISGNYAGSEGDLTLSGTITLEMETESGTKTLRGTFAVHSVTWG